MLTDVYAAMLNSPPIRVTTIDYSSFLGKQTRPAPGTQVTPTTGPTRTTWVTPTTPASTCTGSCIYIFILGQITETYTNRLGDAVARSAHTFRALLRAERMGLGVLAGSIGHYYNMFFNNEDIFTPRPLVQKPPP